MWNYEMMNRILCVGVASFKINKTNYLLAGTNIMETLVVILEADMGVILETEGTGGGSLLDGALHPITSQGHLKDLHLETNE
jgi:hypothetical protein